MRRSEPSGNTSAIGSHETILAMQTKRIKGSASVNPACACCVPQSAARDLNRRRSSSHSPSDGPVGILSPGRPESGGGGSGLFMRSIVAPFTGSPAVRMRSSGRSARRRRTRVRGCEARGSAGCAVLSRSALRAAGEGTRARLWRRTGRRSLLAAVPFRGRASDARGQAGKRTEDGRGEQ